MRARRPQRLAELLVSCEHSMAQSRAEMQRLRPKDRETHYIYCILPEGTAGNTLGAVCGEGGVGCRGTDASSVERGTEGTRGSLGVYRPGGVWRRRRNESRWGTGWLGAGIRARGGLGVLEAVLKGMRLVEVAREGTRGTKSVWMVP